MHRASMMLQDGYIFQHDVRQGPFTAINDAEIEQLFAPLQSATGLVLAISGGPDSLALLLLAARWRALRSDNNIPLISVASVDHALRASAAEEANAVTRLAWDLGFLAQVLVWQGDKPIQGIQEAARMARYQLLVNAARASGASHIVTAHHRDDQAETVLMRLAGGSGVGGLAAMRPLIPLHSSNSDGGNPVLLARPLLKLYKARLEAIVHEAGVIAVDDPANRNPRFARARLRSLLVERSALGLSSDRLATLAERCARADSALATIAQQRFVSLSVAECEKICLTRALWLEPDEIILRSIALAVMQLEGNAGKNPLSLERLEGLFRALKTGRAQAHAVRRTLHGMVVRMDNTGEIKLYPEPERRRGRSLNV